MAIKSPSEHTLSGRHYPVELQFIHESRSGEMAAVSIFAVQGSKNSQLESLVRKVQVGQDLAEAKLQLKPDDLVPDYMPHYQYMGSLTDAPCTKVRWHVLNTPIEISGKQLSELQKRYKGNNNPIQPLNDRKTVNFF